MGSAIARNLFSAGYSLALADMDATALQSLVSTLNATDSHQRAWGKVTDVSETSQVEALCEGAMGTLGPLYVSVNLFGHIRMVTEAIRVFKKQGDAPSSGYTIVTIGIFNVARPQINIAAYSASKGAVKTFNAFVAKENARPEGVLIRVNTVNPGGIRTPMVEGIIAKRGAQVPYEVCPMARWGQPDEIANCVEFLISPKASFVAGAAYDVDGGRNA